MLTSLYYYDIMKLVKQVGYIRIILKGSDKLKNKQLKQLENNKLKNDKLKVKQFTELMKFNQICMNYCIEETYKNLKIYTETVIKLNNKNLYDTDFFKYLFARKITLKEFLIRIVDEYEFLKLMFDTDYIMKHLTPEEFCDVLENVDDWFDFIGNEIKYKLTNELIKDINYQ